MWHFAFFYYLCNTYLNEHLPMKIYFAIALLSFTLMLTACGGDDGLTDTTTENAATDQDQDSYTGTIDSNYTYQLPVVMHVLYRDASDTTQYLKASYLQKLIHYVNELYQGVYSSSRFNIGVNFVLAQYDESGQKLATPGVVYHQYTGSDWPLDVTTVMSDNKQTYNKYVWDPNNYINVLFYPFKTTSSDEVTLGMSRSPYAIASGDSVLPGLETINYRYISKSNLGYAYAISLNSTYAYQLSSRYTQADHGKGGYYLSSTGSDMAQAMAHELGHYLGLFHTFSEVKTATGTADADSCADTDYCTDTHTYNRTDYTSYLTTLGALGNLTWQKAVTRYDCVDRSRYMSYNIMDYNYSYFDTFTPEQKARCRWVLYYSPLIPGPKKNGANKKTSTRAVSNDIYPLPVKYYK